MPTSDSATPVELIRRLTPSAKLSISHQLWETARLLTAAGIRSRTPELTDTEVAARVRETFLRADT